MSYLCFDGWYARDGFGLWLRGWKIVAVTQLPGDRNGVYQGQEQRVDGVVKRHVGLAKLTFVVLQWLREMPEETVGEVKERLQLESCFRDTKSRSLYGASRR